MLKQILSKHIILGPAKHHKFLIDMQLEYQDLYVNDR